MLGQIKVLRTRLPQALWCSLWTQPTISTAGTRASVKDRRMNPAKDLRVHAGSKICAGSMKHRGLHRAATGPCGAQQLLTKVPGSHPQL